MFCVQVSASPHVGAATREAQERVGVELAARIIRFFQEQEAKEGGEGRIEGSRCAAWGLTAGGMVVV